MKRFLQHYGYSVALLVALLVLAFAASRLYAPLSVPTLGVTCPAHYHMTAPPNAHCER